MSSVAVEQDFVVLKHDADMLAQVAQLVVGQIAKVVFVNQHFAGRGFGNARNQAQNGGFARAGMPRDENHLAFLNVEADVFQGLEMAGIHFGNGLKSYHDG